MKNYIKDCMQAMDKIYSFLYYSYDSFFNLLELNHIRSTTEKILYSPESSLPSVALKGEHEEMAGSGTSHTNCGILWQKSKQS